MQFCEEISMTNKKEENISHKKAIEIAENFTKKLGIENMKCVWMDKIQSDVYLNLAPVVNGIIIYPDLIKVKVDMASGEIIGYEACTYYTNHTDRKIGDAKISKEEARKMIDEKYEIQETHLTLSPIDYEGEKLTYEFKCRYQGATYYIYINAHNGITENILKVIETSDGNKLM